MLVAIGLSLLFASMTSALGAERAVHAYVRRSPHALPVLIVQLGMTLWFGIAGAWVLWTVMG